ncbi:hypothetical protein [Nocardia rhizosphaerihabitans]|uniref:hypothetical protein n=1 Tax=Nocardia rhizosphaerihabitans TaxID=1691570 RepID=UPI001664E036|nr:hypothetical protein [Nocardia rhizosphaerihabitans]
MAKPEPSAIIGMSAAAAAATRILFLVMMVPSVGNAGTHAKRGIPQDRHRQLFSWLEWKTIIPGVEIPQSSTAQPRGDYAWAAAFFFRSISASAAM